VAREDEGFSAVFAQLDGEAVVRFAGEIDVAAEERAWAVLDEAIRASSRIVVDMRRVSFMDSTGIGLLLRARQLVVRESSGHVVLRAAPRQVLHLLEVTGLVDHFAMEPG